MGLDQATRDHRWEVSALITHVLEPPPEAMARRVTKTLLHPHSRLADPRWISSANAFIREAAGTAEAYRRFGKGTGKGHDNQKEDGS